MIIIATAVGGFILDCWRECTWAVASVKQVNGGTNRQGARPISSNEAFCRINAAFRPLERRIYAAAKNSVVFAQIARNGDGMALRSV
jgi:predicted N-formylglutamate amidohydrolase